MFNQETKATVKTIARKANEIIGEYYDRNMWQDPMGAHYGVEWMQGDWHDESSREDAIATQKRIDALTNRVFNFDHILSALVRDERMRCGIYGGIEMEICTFVYGEIEFDQHATEPCW